VAPFWMTDFWMPEPDVQPILFWEDNPSTIKGFD